MRYVSRIYDKQLKCEVPSAAFLCDEYNRYDIFVSDTEDRSLLVKHHFGMKCIGYIVEAGFQDIVVAHSHAKALLTKFVESAETVEGTSCVDAFTLDVFTQDYDFVCSGDEITIYTGEDAYKSQYGVIGKYCYEDFTGDSTITMYDMLVSLCRRCKCNVMQYGTIRLTSNYDAYITTIKLVQSEEAKRFFTKMAVVG